MAAVSFTRTGERGIMVDRQQAPRHTHSLTQDAYTLLLYYSAVVQLQRGEPSPADGAAGPAGDD